MPWLPNWCNLSFDESRTKGDFMAAIVIDASQAPVRRRRKAYTPPVLTKGPVLAKVAAAQISNGNDDCWVARAAFGEADFRWMIFRAWLFEDAPAWFRAGYLRHGRRVGAWLAGRDAARAVVRAAMLVAVRRKLTVR
jgi:hypothetical protein